VVQLQSSCRHANNKDKPSQTGEPACAGHPIIADRMPRTEGSSRLSLALARRLSTFTHFQPSLAYFPRRPAATGSGPCSICVLTRKPSQKPLRTTIASLYTPALRGSWLAGSARQFSDRSSTSPSSSPSPAPCLSSPIRPPRWRLQ